MARTVDQIKTEINTAKAANPALDGLNSVSNTAIYTLWIFLTATMQAMFERFQDAFKSDVQTIIDNNQYGNDGWWYKKILEFQYGDLLVFLNNIYQYPAIDTTKQIVDFCSITSNGGKVQIKAAAALAGQPVVLSSGQVAGLLAYCQTIRPSGIKFTVQSLAADTLVAYLNIYYNASGDIAVIKPAVEAAIQNYLSNLNTAIGTVDNQTIRNFDGTLYVNRLIDAIQTVPGVVGPQVEVISMAAKNGADAYQTFTSSYAPKAGYFMVDPAYSLATTITYIAA